MVENSKIVYNKVCYSLKNLEENNKIIKYDELFKLYDSVVNSHSPRKSNNFKITSNADSVSPINNSQKNNLIDNIIKDKIIIYKNNLFNKSNKPKNNNLNKNEKNIIIKKNDKNINNHDNNTFLTNTNIKISKKKFIEKETSTHKSNEIIPFGKSLNDILIKNINDENINKGILIQRPTSTKNIYKPQKLIKNSNYNNYQNHMEIFKQTMKKEFGNYLTEYELAHKKKLRSFSKKVADKKEKVIKALPIYIKGYKKNPIDIFHSRKIFDLEYQKFYSRPCINIEEVLQYQNSTGDYNFKEGKIPYYYFLRSVENPFNKRKLFKKRPKSGNIYITFNN